ncbi:MAG: hypothetical protein KC940_07930 [Candidatus Omnitrophica bacterium]|nr:hypothetical protein [Candidatus Omnitrophota bacterium]
MPNCKNCGAEVDIDQKTCAWCGAENPASGGKPAAPQPKPKPPQPSPPAPQPSASGSEMRTHKGTGPSIEDARNLAQRGDLDGALSLFHRIHETQPNNQEALFGIGGIHFKKNEPKKAIESWLKLKVLNPNYPNLENWIQQAKQKLPPAPEKPSPRPTHSASPSSLNVEEDWRQQSVKVTDPQVDTPHRAPKPAAKPKQEKTQIDEILEEDDDGSIKPRSWVIPMGWGLLTVYLLVIWILYFSAWIRG